MDKEWETTPANEFLDTITHNNRKITMNCPWNSYKNQQEMLLLLKKKINLVHVICTYSKNLNISACLFSLFLHNFISTLTLFQSKSRCRAGSQPICTKYCPKCHVFMIIYWFFELGIYFFWHFVLIFSTTWSQQLFWILIQNDWKLLQKFCIKFQIFWIYLQIWVL